ncbi:hypothetical protein [Paenibacillus alkalitolerans]|uniref:hypothetical protein n=1 Tax=Paenibacillus alkalitolerans TaxID=2799335 RepID=UPI0018F4B430|nr:hypothetical protein [Paenibacillus alkalitolerans]
MGNLNKTTIGIIVIMAIVISFVFGVPHNIRYYFEKQFGEPHTFFWGTGLGVIVDKAGYYEDEINLDDTDSPIINVSQYGKNFELFLYGRITNSNDPLVVILNDKVLYNGHPSRENGDIFGEYYIEKHYVVKLEGIKRNSNNKLIISTGNNSEKYNIVTK